MGTLARFTLWLLQISSQFSLQSKKKKSKLDATALLAKLGCTPFALSPFLDARARPLAVLGPTRFSPGDNWVVMSGRLDQGADVEETRQTGSRQTG